MAIADVSGAEAEKLIPKVEAAVRDYTYNQAGDYRIWPGPNSNSFTAAVLRAVPELRTMLPPNAVGRDFRNGFYGGYTDSRTGIELNLWGVADIKIGWVEGIEVTCSVSWPGSTSAILASSCRVSAASASNRGRHRLGQISRGGGPQGLCECATRCPCSIKSSSPAIHRGRSRRCKSMSAIAATSPASIVTSMRAPPARRN
ncbi:MAG: DUF3750 domain-containing protein [Pseudolabrys sp.]